MNRRNDKKPLSFWVGNEKTNETQTYPLQPCFGIEYTAGTLFCDNCRDKKKCWVKKETGCVPVGVRKNT